MALVEIARFIDLTEAQVAASALRSSGMLVFVQNEHWGQANYPMQTAMGGFRLWATEEDAPDARAFINEHRRKPATIAPLTGSEAASWGLLSVVLSLVAGVMTPLRPRRFKPGEEEA